MLRSINLVKHHCTKKTKEAQHHKPYLRNCYGLFF